LIAEDEPVIARLMGRIVSQYARVHVCDDFEGAVAYLRQTNYVDLVLSDLTLRAGSGMELYTWISTHRPSLQPKIGFVTGGASSDETCRFLAQVRPPYLLKPFTRRELLTFAGRLLGTPLQPAPQWRASIPG
jgi:DNA-binding response OmpR family regulator